MAYKDLFSTAKNALKMIFPHYANYQSVVETNQSNRENIMMQNQWNLDQWNRENAYNDPMAVMQRMRRAGLNPGLMYEGGAGQLASAPSPEMQGARDIAPQMTGMPTLADFANIASVRSQARLADAQAGLISAQEDEIRQKLPEQLNQLRIQNQELQQRIDNLVQDNKESQARISSMSVDDQYKLAQKARLEFQSAMDNKNFGLELRRLNQDIKESNSRVAINERRLYEDLQTWSYRLAGFDLENERVRAATGLTLQQTKNAEKDGELLGFQVTSGSIDAHFDQWDKDAIDGKHGWLLQQRTKLKSRLTHEVGRLTGILPALLKK